MKCKIIGTNLRVFSKGVRLLSKISNDILIIADNNRLKLQAINDNKTAFIEIHFESSFFSTYECNAETKCKLFMKSLILVFRVINIDRNVDVCTVIMDESMPRIVFQMKCFKGVYQEYFIPYMESNGLLYRSNQSRSNPSFKCESKLLAECLHNFSAETKDITLWLTSDQILFKSYFDDSEDHNIITSFAYKSNHFRNYVFTHEISVTFDLKDIKPFIEFSSFRDQTLECYFEESGKPIVLTFTSNDHYSAKIILATHDFPEDLLPIPPVLNSNRSSYQSSSLLCTGDLIGQPLDEMNVNSNRSMNSSEIPLITSNTCVTNTTNDNNEDDDPFGDEDDEILEQLISQMPEFSTDHTIPNQTTEFLLTGSALRQYHMSVLFGNDEDDNPVTSSDDIIVPDSDEEQ